MNAPAATDAIAATSPRPWERYSGARRLVFLSVLFLVATLNYIDKNVINVLLEPIKADFQLSDTELGVLTGASFAVLYALLSIPVARWCDRGDRKLIISICLCAWSAMTMLCGAAQSFWLLAAARMGVGAAETGRIPPGQSLIADYYPPERRGLAIGIFMMSAFAGGTLALAIGSWIAENYGWRAAFLAAGAPGILLALLTWLVLEEPRGSRHPSIRSGAHESTMAAFRALTAKPAYVYNLVAKIAFFMAAYGALSFIVSFMIRVHGMSIAEAGRLYALISGAASLAGSLAGGLLADRLLRRNVAWLARLPAWALMAAWPLAVLAFVTPSVMVMSTALFAMLFLFWSSSPAMFSALHAICGSERRTLAVAIVFCLANLLGIGLGPVVTGAISDHFAVTHGAAQGLRYALIVVVAVLLPGGYCMLRAARHMQGNLER